MNSRNWYAGGIALLTALMLTGCGSGKQRIAGKSNPESSGRISLSGDPPAESPIASSPLRLTGAIQQSQEPMTITAANFDQVVLNSPVPVLIDCWAPWCGPCRRMGPVVDSLAEEYEGRAIVAKLDIQACPEIAQRYGVTNIPAFLYFQNGQVVDRVVGAVPKSQLERRLASIAHEVQTVSGETDQFPPARRAAHFPGRN